MGHLIQAINIKKIQTLVVMSLMNEGFPVSVVSKGPWLQDIIDRHS